MEPMRLLILALLALPAFGGNPKQLLRDIKTHDPTVLPENVETEAAVKRIARNNEFEKNLLPVKRRALKAQLDRWERTVESLGASDDAKTARTLCGLFAAASARIDEAHAARDQCVVNWKNTVLYHDAEKNRNTIKKGQTPVYHRNQTNEEIWHQFTYGLLGVRISCARLLRRLESPDARQYLAQAMLKQNPPELRAKIAEILTANPKADPAPILAAIKKERSPGVRAALLIAISRLDKARGSGAVVAHFVKDRSERVRVAAARALERMHVVEGVEPLIEQMEKEEGLTKSVMARALESMTGEKFGTHPEVWRKWWAAQQGKLLGGGLPPRSDEAGDDEGDRKRGHFYGIPQVSLKIIYIIDVSGSMKKDIGGKTRLEACKTELSHAISQLPRRAMFDVILYHRNVTVWKKQMQVAGPLKKGRKGNKDAAKEFYAKARPEGSTNIYDALRAAFKVAGEGTKKKNARLNADTIYLLTDGSPTTPAGKMDDVKKILEGARKWNALGRVTIHTIGIGKDLNRPFLEQLARENNGRFISK